ncbi:ABC transporter permease [Rhodanobacter lindaniclasticus]
MTGAGVFLFVIPLRGSFGLLLASLVLFILSVVGIGLMISAVSATQQQAILGAFAIGVPAVLMSGFATPVENMPVALQWMAQAIPPPTSRSSSKARFSRRCRRRTSSPTSGRWR